MIVGTSPRNRSMYSWQHDNMTTWQHDNKLTSVGFFVPQNILFNGCCLSCPKYFSLVMIKRAKNRNRHPDGSRGCDANRASVYERTDIIRISKPSFPWLQAPFCLKTVSTRLFLLTTSKHVYMTTSNAKRWRARARSHRSERGVKVCTSKYLLILFLYAILVTTLILG